MKKLSILIVALAMTTLSLPGGVYADNGPAEIKLPASMGEITFDHATHQTRVTDCSTCHHMEPKTACRSCHGVKPEAPSAKKAFHASCKDCHKQKGGPTACKQCHSGPRG